MKKHIHTDGGLLDYDYITDDIYIGTNQCCMAGLSEVLKKEGITADISLEDTRLDHPFGVSMYVWLPTKDLTAPSFDQLMFGVRALTELVRQKRKVYVHCKNGHGRATTLVAAYLIFKDNTPDEAIRRIKEKRPDVHLQDSQYQTLVDFSKQKLS